MPASPIRLESLLCNARERELTDRREHRESRRAVVRRAAEEQALVAERRDELERRSGRRDDALDRLERRAADEDREIEEGCLFPLVEQRVAPLDRGGERALALGQVARAPREERQALAEALEDRA